MVKARKRTAVDGAVWFNKGTLINVLLIPIISTVFLGGGGYFLGKYLIEQNAIAIKEESIRREAAVDAEAKRRELAFAEIARKREESQKTDDANREALRQALLDNAKETTKGLSTLAAHSLVQDEQIKNVGSQVQNAGSSIERLVSAVQNLEIAVGRATASPSGARR